MTDDNKKDDTILSKIIDVDEQNVRVIKTELVDHKNDLPISLRKKGIEKQCIIDVRDIAISQGATNQLYPMNCKFLSG